MGRVREGEGGKRERNRGRQAVVRVCAWEGVEGEWRCIPLCGSFWKIMRVALGFRKARSLCPKMR